MIQLAIIAVYLTLLLVLGFAASRMFRGTSSDYMLASHTIGPFLLLMSLFGTTMTAFALVGSTGRAYTLGVGVYGIMASASGIVHSLCFFLIGVRLWRLGYKHGYTTQIQFFRDRLQSDRIGLLLFPVLVGLVIPYLLIGVIGAGVVVNNVTRDAFVEYGWFAAHHHAVPPQLASAVVCLVVLIYVFFGGMRGTAWANAFQTLVFMVLGVVTFYIIAKGLGGKDSLLESLQAATAAVDRDHLTRARIPIPIFASFLLIPLSVAMFPHVFQHWLTARSASAFKLPIVAHPIFIMIVWLPCVLIGVWASAEMPGLKDENAVLGRMVQQLATPALGGLLTAGILAAIMSSLDSQFLCIGAMFTNDIVLHYRPKAHFTERQKVLFVLAVVTVTYLLSAYFQSLPEENRKSVFGLAIWCFSGFSGLFPLVFAAVYWKRLTKVGAYASVLTMVVVWSALFYRSDFGSNKRYAFPEPMAEGGGASPLEAISSVLLSLGIPPMVAVVTIFSCSAMALVVGSLLTRPPGEETLARFFPATKDGE